MVEEGEAEPLDEASLRITHVDGPLFSEITETRQWGDTSESILEVTARLSRGTSDEAALHLEHTIPMIPLNHEVIFRVHTDLANDEILHDDSGLELYPSDPDTDLPISGRCVHPH
jgi:hypothetical protein